MQFNDFSYNCTFRSIYIMRFNFNLLQNSQIAQFRSWDQPEKFRGCQSGSAPRGQSESHNEVVRIRACMQSTLTCQPRLLLICQGQRALERPYVEHGPWFRSWDCSKQSFFRDLKRPPLPLYAEALTFRITCVKINTAVLNNQSAFSHQDARGVRWLSQKDISVS